MAKPTPPSAHALRVADLSQNRPTAIALRPDSDTLKLLAGELDLLGLRKLSFTGEIIAQDGADWTLTGQLGATVVQPCSVTLDPVTTRIDTAVTRRFLADLHDITAPEVEMPEDDTTEPLGAWIDPYQIMIEALVLALPLYPRSADAELGEQVFAEPGVTPMRDEDARPFAGLAALRDTLSDPDRDDS